MPNCKAPLVIEDTPVGEMCHIRARRKNGPRYDPNLTAKERDAAPNIILLCGTCHALVDKNPEKYSSELLSEIKELHERGGAIELTADISKQALLLLDANKLKPKTRIKNQSSINIGRDNYGPVTVNQSGNSRAKQSKAAKNRIWSDANLSGYIDYLCDIHVKYIAPFEPDPDRAWARVGKKIKNRFRLRKQSRNDLPVDKFYNLVDYLHQEIRATPVGKQHIKRGTKPFRSFEEWRSA